MRILLLFLLSCLPAFAQLVPNTNPPVSVTVEWSASTSSVAGYRVYWGNAPRAYTAVRDAGNSLAFTVTNLVVGSTYYLAATAYNNQGTESSFSSEVSYVVQPRPEPPSEFRTIAIINVIVPKP